jgi:hypothetical protein
MHTINISTSTISTQFFSIWDTNNNISPSSDFGGYVTINEYNSSLSAMVYCACSPTFKLESLTINTPVTKFLGEIYVNDFKSDGNHIIENFLD